MKKISLLLMMAFVAIVAWAVPARQGVITHRQTDGTELSLQLVGDEYLHYFVNLATGEKMEQGADGDFHVIANSTLQTRTAVGSARRITANAERVQRLPAMQRMAAPGAPNRAIGNFTSMTGTKRGIVILVNYTDVQFKSANNQTAFYNQFNQEGYSKNSHIGSVRDFFRQQSYGNFTVDFDVVGPYTLSHNMAYYGANSGGSDVHPGEMIIEAVRAADADGVDFSQYDWDGDREVDQVFVIYAGYAEAQGAPSNTIWPHQWTLAAANYYRDGDGPQTIDGVTIDQYACTAELCGSSGSTMDGIGTACHEFSHCLGYPDLYDTRTGGSNWGMNHFDLMNSGSYNGPNYHGEVPCGYSAYERWMAGWLTPTVLTPGDHVTVTDLKPLNDTPEAYIIYNDNNSNEYIILENRQNNNWFRYLNTYTTGHGLLATHIDYNSSDWSNNTVNNTAGHERLKYIAADGTFNTSTLPKDYFGPVSGVTALTSTSHTSVGGQWFNNTKAGSKVFSGMDITDIAESGGNISFKFNGGAPEDDGSRYTITYWVNGSKSEWTQTNYREETTVMTIPEDFEDWMPMGWSYTDYQGLVPAENVVLISYIIEGNKYTPTEDITLYAVYSDMEAEYCTSHPVQGDNSVTLSVMGATTTWTQTAAQREFTLPTPETVVAGWTFVGWTTAAVENTATKPVIVPAGTKVQPVSDVTYYAVFTQRGGQGGAQLLYRLVDTMEDGATYVIATTNTLGSAYALDASKLSGASTSVAATAVTIADNSGMTIADPDDSLLWTATYNSNQKVWNLANGDNYLVINGSGIALSSSAGKLYWSDSYGLYGKSNSGSTSYYLYGTGTTIATRQSGKEDSRIYIYQGGASVTYYSTNPAVADYTVTFDAGSGSCSVASFAQDNANDIVSNNLPSATIDIEGWTFYGWAAEAVGNTTVAPTILAAGASYTPLDNVTLYAVYTATCYNGAQPQTLYCSNPTEAPANVFYSVTLRNGDEPGSLTFGTPWSQTVGAFDFTFPTPEVTYEGWTFYGWAATPVAQTPDAPEVHTVGSLYTPAANAVFYSVYVNAKPAYISNPEMYIPGGGTQNPQFYFPHIAYVGKPFTAPRFNTDSEGALHFSSSNPAVASVDESTGKVTILSAGIAIITVNQDATAAHKPTSATYMIKVVE